MTQTMHPYKSDYAKIEKVVDERLFARLGVIVICCLAAYALAAQWRDQHPVTFDGATQYMVPEGQMSLWDVAASLPFGDEIEARRIVEPLAAANKLDTVAVSPGQVLTVPERMLRNTALAWWFWVALTIGILAAIYVILAWLTEIRWLKQRYNIGDQA